MDIISYILSKKYTDNTVDGLGAIKGAPCTVKSVVDIDGGKRITLEWESNSGVKQTQSFDIMDGEDGANTVEWSQIQQSGTKIAEININGVSTDVYAPTGGGGSANIVNCTQAEYDALPSSKESDDVLYIVYFDGAQVLDPDYSYYTYGDNDEIIVRVYHEGQSDQQTLWFFRGWNQTGTIISIPSELSAYAPTVTNQAIASKNFTDNTGATQNGWVGFYSDSIRAWSQDWASNITGIMYGVVDPEGAGYPNPQTNSYIDNPYIYIPNSDTTRRIYMNGREYAEFNGENSESSWIDIQGTLLAGNTSVTLSNPSIKNTSDFEFFTDVFGVCPTNVSVSNGSITLTFDEQANDLGVKVRVTNPSVAVTYSYLKWQLLKTRGNPPHAGALQVSEFYMGVNGSDYSWGNTTITSNMAGASEQQNITSLIDSDILTKYCTVVWGNVQTNECNITITLDGSISASDITGYSFVTGEDEPSRDPISWKLYGSSDGTNWDLIDEQIDYNVTTERRTRVNILL